MPLSLKFHIGNLLIGMFISIWWFHDEKEKVGLPWGAFTLLGSWMTLMAFYFSAENPSVSFIQALPATLDVNQFRFGSTQMKGVVGTVPANAASLLMAVLICTYILFFKWFWPFRNKLVEERKRRKSLDTKNNEN